MKNVLVNGASITRGPNRWPCYFQTATNCNLINLALSGCGHTYIHDNTVTELAQRSYDLVLVMWPESGRIDMRVGDVDQFDSLRHTSLFESMQNDWPEKIVEPVNDQDYVQKDWIFSAGYLQHHQDAIAQVFEPIHKLTTHAQILESELIKIISLQAILKQQGTPYLFMFWQPFKRFERFNHYYNMIDWTNVYTDNYLESIAKQNNWIGEDSIHPSDEAHKVFADLIVKRLGF